MNAIAPSSEYLQVMGGNNPPEPTSIEIAQGVFDDLTLFLAEMPVVQTDEQSRAIKARIDSAKAALDAMESDRDSQVRPLNTTVKEINARFKAVSSVLESLMTEALKRAAAWARAEEARLEAIAAEKRRVADEAIAAANAAAGREIEARENAAEGEFTDVGVAILDTDEAKKVADRAVRESARADRDTRVRIGGGYGKAMGLRDKETLTIVDGAKALKAIIKASDGVVPDKITDAILASARAYRKMKGKLPDGIESSVERSL